MLRTLATMAAKAQSSARLRLALIQMATTVDKEHNLATAERNIAEASANGADLVILPECFNSPYGTKYFAEYAETIPGKSSQRLSAMAKQHKVYLIGGSIPEKDGQNLYNTCPVFDREGTMVAKHRKVHLFDIDVLGGIHFQESETLSAGSSLTVFDTEYCKIGIGVCYDVRFAEMAMIYADQGCRLLAYPGAFNMTTGPRHWELLLRARANDSQLFVCGAAPARDTTADYISWGHSTVVNPWGEVVATSEDKPCIVFGDLDMADVDAVRNSIPIRKQRRNDLYSSPQPVASK